MDPPARCTVPLLSLLCLDEQKKSWLHFMSSFLLLAKAEEKKVPIPQLYLFTKPMFAFLQDKPSFTKITCTYI